MWNNFTQKEALIKSFLEDLHSISYSTGKSKHQTFTNFLEIAYCVTHNTPYTLWFLEKDEAYETTEAKYLELINKHKKDQIDKITKMYWYLMKFYQAERNYDDFLWTILEKEWLIDATKWQYFTPIHICDFMSKILDTKPYTKIKEQWYYTICDPCAWAWRFIISSAQITNNEWYDDKTQMIFEATDIDRNCFLMTYIQTSMLWLAGVIKWGDTLAQKFHEIQETPTYKIIKSKENVERYKKVKEEIKTLQRLEMMRNIIQWDAQKPQNNTTQISNNHTYHEANYQFQEQKNWNTQWVLF